MSSMDDEASSAPAAPAIGTALGATAGTAAVIAYAFSPERAGRPSMLGAIAALYAVLGVHAILRLKRRGELRRLFVPARGDVTMAAFTAGALYGGARIMGSLL